MTGKSNAGCGPIPLVFGITGHRDLIPADIPGLEATVREIFQAVQSRYPHSPLRLVSSLAEGADRLAARVALELGAELLATLPMPSQEYERDFATNESIQEFESLLGKASQTFELPAVPEPTSFPGSTPLTARDHQYEQVGIYMVRHSHFLIALWDGEDPGLPGGTASIVQFRIGGVPHKRLHPLDVPDVGILFHVPARRQQDANSSISDYSQFCVQAWAKANARLDGTWEAGAGTYATCCPKSTSMESFDRTLGRIEEFNRAAIEVGVAGANHSSETIADAFDRSDVPVLVAHKDADRLAGRFRATYRRALIAIYWTGAATGLSFGVLNLPGFRMPSLAMAYAVFFLATIAVFQLQKKKDWFDHYLEYRALAEGLRVQRFWQIAGLGHGDDRAEAFDMYLDKQIGELGWIRESLRALSFHERVGSTETGRQFVLEHWVKEQGDYFTAAAERDRLKQTKLDRIANVLYGAGLVVALVIRGLTFSSSSILNIHRPLALALRFLLVMPGFGALVSSYSRHLALDEQKKTYHRMAHLFSLGRQQIQGSAAEEDLTFYETVIHTLGSEALRESADWLHLRSTHPVVSPYKLPRVALPWRRKRKLDHE